MKVGIAVEVTNLPFQRRPWHELYQDYLWLMCEAEQLGIDYIGLEEHFFLSTGHGPSVPAFAATLADRTSSIKIGSWVSILPLHHPAHLAQEMATLDQLSQGRIFVTAGLGYRAYEYEAFGLDRHSRASRMDEGLEILKRAWTQHPFSFDGRHWQLHDLDVRPEPFQQPHPPLWVGASSVPAARRAARNRAHLAAITREPSVFEAYRAGLVDAGEDPSAYRVSLPCSITTTMEDPDVVWGRNRVLYRHRWTDFVGYIEEYGDAGFQFGATGAPTDESGYRGNELIGTPDEVLTAVQELVSSLPVTDLTNIYPAPGIPLRTEAIDSLRLFATEVVPVLKSW